MIRITDSIAIERYHIKESFVRAAGPGGQNVNKVSTAVELRFDVANAALPSDLKARLKVIAGRQLNQDGELVIFSQEHRSQERNRDAALNKLVSMLKRAAHRPRRRIATRPTKASRVRRLDSKAKRSKVKKLRTAKPLHD